jgi:hypothetical protein
MSFVATQTEARRSAIGNQIAPVRIWIVDRAAPALFGGGPWTSSLRPPDRAKEGNGEESKEPRPETSRPGYVPNGPLAAAQGPLALAVQQHSRLSSCDENAQECGRCTHPRRWAASGTNSRIPGSTRLRCGARPACERGRMSRWRHRGRSGSRWRGRSDSQGGRSGGGHERAALHRARRNAVLDA